MTVERTATRERIASTRRGSFRPLACLALCSVVWLGCGGTGEPTVDGIPASGPDGEWPQWRGPERTGVVQPSGPLATQWPEGEPKTLWRRDLGEGLGGIAVADGRAYALAARRSSEALVAFDARLGTELWRLDLGETFKDGHGNGPRSTPAVHEGTVYATGSRRIVAADASNGAELWTRPLGEAPQWGFSSSPLVDGELLIVHGTLDQPAESSPDERGAVIALDRATGATAWTAEPGHPGYSSPLIAEIAGRRHLVSFVAAGLLGLDPQTGERLWIHPWTTAYSVNAADPIILPGDRIFISAGYDSGSQLLQILADGEGFRVEEVWRTHRMKNHFSSSVLVGEHIFGFDNSTLQCLQVVDGKPCWRQRGFGKGSLITTGDHLLVLGDEGTLALVEASGDEYRELGRVQALEYGSWAPPSLAGQWIYLRNHDEIVSLNLAE